MRSLTTDFKTAITPDQVSIGALVEIDYPTPLRAWSGVGELTWDGKTWAGVGGVGEFSAVVEKAGAEAGQMKLKMSGVDPVARARALLNTSASRGLRCWLAAFSVDGADVWTVLPDPWKFFSGITDVHRVHNGAIEVNVETVLSRLKYPKIARYTNEEQQRHYPGDTSMRHAGTISNKPFYWGTATPLPAYGGTPGDSGGDVYVLS